jgi:hypothetical protein
MGVRLVGEGGRIPPARNREELREDCARCLVGLDRMMYEHVILPERRRRRNEERLFKTGIVFFTLIGLAAAANILLMLARFA